MSDKNTENEMLDAIAMAMTNGFRSYIGALRTGIAAGQDPRIKEKAYRIVESDLRTALGIAPTTPREDVPDQRALAASIASQNAPLPYDGTVGDPDDFPPSDEYEQHTFLSHIGPSARTQDGSGCYGMANVGFECGKGYARCFCRYSTISIRTPSGDRTAAS